MMKNDREVSLEQILGYERLAETFVKSIEKQSYFIEKGRELEGKKERELAKEP